MKFLMAVYQQDCIITNPPPQDMQNRKTRQDIHWSIQQKDNSGCTIKEPVLNASHGLKLRR